MASTKTQIAPKNLSATIATSDRLDVRRFEVVDTMSSLFEVRLVALCTNPDVDFEAVAGLPARFVISQPNGGERSWNGLCSAIQQVRVEEGGASTYELTIVPRLWFLTQKRNHRAFQQISEPDIVVTLLDEWQIEHRLAIDRNAYKTRKYRVQYAESDYAFVCRMLEDVGISFYFESQGDHSVLVVSDTPHRNEPRSPAIHFHDSPDLGAAREHVTNVRIGRRVRPGRYVMQDHDYRLAPDFPLVASAAATEGGVEDRLERFHYAPGAFLFGTDQGEPTPSADDKGRTRSDPRAGEILASKRLDAKRGAAKTITFRTSALDLAPGTVLRIDDHPRSDLRSDHPLLVVGSRIRGEANEPWTHECEARSTTAPHRPPLATPKPRVTGVESATVVGPNGEEIHTDEFGRVRVHFHWDRSSGRDDTSSCWIHVSQPWSGSGFGGMNLPRVGQEVLVSFLGGDPDRPIIVGRVYTNLQKVPYKLPEHKTRSGWRSASTGNGTGYNEIMFEDAAGREQVVTHAEKDRSDHTNHDHASTVQNDRTAVVGHDDSERVGGNKVSQIAGSVTKIVGGSESRQVGGSVNWHVGPERASSLSAAAAGGNWLVYPTTEALIAIAPPGSTPTTWIQLHEKEINITTGNARVRLMDDAVEIWAKKNIVVKSEEGDIAVEAPAGKIFLKSPG
jgi:type VI secretion system secreted protein VgrG